jgi:hypothetical protein
MTALADLLSDRDRRRLEDRLAELGGLADLMRQPGTLPSVPEPVPLHRSRGRTENCSTSFSENCSTTERTSTS